MKIETVVIEGTLVTSVTYLKELTLAIVFTVGHIGIAVIEVKKYQY